MQAFLKYKDEDGRWHIVPGVEDLSYGAVRHTTPEAALDCFYASVDVPETAGIKARAVEIDFRRGEGIETLITNSEAYLLNEHGETVQRLN